MLKMSHLMFENPEFESNENNVDALHSFRITARNVFKFLLIGENRNLSRLSKSDLMQLLKGMFWKKNPTLMLIFRQEARAILKRVYDQVSKLAERNEAIDELINLNIVNILSLYVLFEPTPFDGLIQIPRYIDGKFELVDFSLEVLELTPFSLLDPNEITDDDRVFAYGLTPIQDVNRLIIFAGTTFPTGQGINIQSSINYDYPNTSVGEMYCWDKIIKWLGANDTLNKVDLCGASQGGSLSLLLSLMHPERVGRADALNPPGMLEDYSENHLLFGAWDRLRKENPQKLPKVVIQAQTGDPVSALGFWKDEWQVYKVTASNGKGVQWPPVLKNYYAHIACFAGQDDIAAKIEKMTGKEGNTSERAKLTQRYFVKGRYLNMLFRRYIGLSMDLIKYPAKLYQRYFGAKPSMDKKGVAKIHSKVYFNQSLVHLNTQEIHQALLWSEKAPQTNSETSYRYQAQPVAKRRELHRRIGQR